jgi:hypothetical protein
MLSANLTKTFLAVHSRENPVLNITKYYCIERILEIEAWGLNKSIHARRQLHGTYPFTCLSVDLDTVRVRDTLHFHQIANIPHSELYYHSTEFSSPNTG